jgi:hypothetical protein
LGRIHPALTYGRALGLTQVPCLPPAPYADIWAVAHPDVWPSGKVAAFCAALRAHQRRIRALCVL